MSFVIPDEIIRAARLTEQEVAQALAVALFQQERLTLGQAARLAGVAQIEFQGILARRGITLHYDVAELEQDLQTLAALRRP